MNIKDILGLGQVNIQNMNVIVMSPAEAKSAVVNPGISYGEDGKANWSTPLQQQLDIMRDAVGTTTDDVTQEPTPEETQELGSDQEIDRLRKLAAIFTPPTQPAGG